MTGVVVVRDPDPVRRERAAAAAAGLLRSRGSTTVGHLGCGDVSVTWGGHDRTPVDTAEGDGRAAVVLGDLIGDDGWCDAATYLARSEPGRAPPPFDGCHVAVTVVDDGTVTADVDHLGLLPLYHASVDGVLLVATQPGLLRAHERFRPVLDREGLAGLLLTDALVAGRTVLRGVRRLAPGCALVCRPDRPVEEVDTATVPVSTGMHDATIAECALAIDDAQADAVRRHLRPGRRHALLLSGGHDSRVLAGTLARTGAAVEAITFGARHDLEHRFASRVARTLGIPHRLLPDDADEARFEDVVRWEGLVATPSVSHDEVGGDVDALLSGYVADHVWGEPFLDWIAGRDDGGLADAFVATLNHWAIPVPELRRLLDRPGWVGALDAATDATRASFEASGATGLERAWRSVLRTRGRFWVGHALWRHAAHAWPSIPQLDRTVVATAASVPLALLENRSLQRLLLAERYPALARIPLELTTFESTAIVPRPADVLRSTLERRTRRLLQALRLPTREVRVNARTLDIRRPGWTAVRRRLEPLRPLAHDLFDPPTFDELLPPPDRPWTGPWAYPCSNPAKLLLGVLALLDDGVAV